MPSLERDSQRIVIAGASSLLGTELRSVLEDGRFAGADLRLLDEPSAAGTLTAAGGEPTVIQPVEEESFTKARFVFFTGSAEFTLQNVASALRAGAKVIDLSGGTASREETVPWFPKLDALRGREFPKDAPSFMIPSAAATAAAALTFALSKIGLRRVMAGCFHSAAEAGRLGIEELESQTGQLLSFQGVGQPIFDTQVAFNMLDRFGPASSQKLSAIRERVRTETDACLKDKCILHAIQLVHTPVFYGTAFSIYGELDTNADVDQILKACYESGFVIPQDGEAGPSNVGVAGEKEMQLAKPEADPSHPRVWWFWGAADNMRLPATNAVKLATMLS